jgi:hypothetical protein
MIENLHENSTKSKGAVWICWGNVAKDDLSRSVESVKKLGISTCIITNCDKSILPDVDMIINFEPVYNTCQDRVAQLIRSAPYDLCLHLDTDTEIQGGIEFGFDMASAHGLAICIAPAAFASRWHCMPDEYPIDLVQYNCGAFFFDKTNLSVQELFEKWAENISKPLSRMKNQDQPAFAAAVHETGFNPFVLPKNWNFRPDFGDINAFGPIKIWHSQKPFPVGIPNESNFWNLNNSTTSWQYDKYNNNQIEERKKVFNFGLADFISKQFKPKSVFEFGCGLGLYLDHIAQSTNASELHGIEPNGIPSNTKKVFIHAIDIVRDGIPISLLKNFDLVYSIEVLEHIEQKYHCDIILFLSKICERVFVFSAAQPGQEGVGHISCRPQEEWIELISSNGFKLCSQQTFKIRQACDKKNINHRNNLLVFKKRIGLD